MSKQHKTSIGGQALIEGIMMKGPEKSAMAVRLPNKSIDVEVWENKTVENNNAIVSSSVFFMIFIFCWCLSLSKADCHFDRLSDLTTKSQQSKANSLSL